MNPSIRLSRHFLASHVTLWRENQLMTRKPWVTKTDMSRFVRCPYSYWLLFKGEIQIEDTISEFSQHLVSDGIAFQEELEAAATPTQLKLPDYADVGVRILNTPTMENPHLRIRGRPDGIDTDFGTLIPIEVKSHKAVTLLDELELAFYWLLLEPFRSRHLQEPRGTIILRTEAGPEIVSVPITVQRMERVHEYLEEIRRVQKIGVQPRICGCNVCGNLLRKEVRLEVAKRKDVSMIHGVGYRYAQCLDSFGYGTWPKLLKADPEAIVADFRNVRVRGVNLSMMKKWQSHAQSFKTGKPVPLHPVDALDFPFGFIALDLEYEPIIWLIGARYVGNESTESHFLWANSRRSEKANMLKLANFLDAHPDAPLVTWAGNSADIPRLRKAAIATGISEALDIDSRRHVDLHLWAERNVRLPIPGTGLKEVEEYFGFPRITRGVDGFMAVWMYAEYSTSKDPKIRERLIDYNRDDVDSLIHVVERLQDWASTVEPTPKYGDPRFGER
ncbi:MAG: TM0106 family RecB-like putative nuclease [Acidimicrobiales bacterium]